MWALESHNPKIRLGFFRQRRRAIALGGSGGSGPWPGELDLYEIEFLQPGAHSIRLESEDRVFEERRLNIVEYVDDIAWSTFVDPDDPQDGPNIRLDDLVEYRGSGAEVEPTTPMRLGDRRYVCVEALAQGERVLDFQCSIDLLDNSSGLVTYPQNALMPTDPRSPDQCILVEAIRATPQQLEAECQGATSLLTIEVLP